MAHDSIIDLGTFRMSKGGAFVRCQDHPELPAGTIVWSFGYAGARDKWAVTGRELNGRPEVVKLDENSRHDYFSHPFHALDRYADSIENEFGIGFYYDLKAERATADEIAAAIDRANEFIERTAREEAEEKEAARIAWEKATEEAREKYGQILTEQTDADRYNTVFVCKNIRKALADRFPGQKFSVRKESYDCIRVYWTDGPTDAQVQAAAGMFEIPSERDPYNEDLYDYTESAFNALYGGVKYLWFQRELSRELEDALAAEIEAICPDTAGQGFHGDLFAHEGGSALYAKYFQGEDIRLDMYSWHDSHNLARTVLFSRDMYRAPERKEKAAQAVKKAERAEGAGLSIVDYSEKAIAVTGDTRALADTLKALGGRFNARLSCGAGWIFSKRKEAEVREALAL